MFPEGLDVDGARRRYCCPNCIGIVGYHRRLWRRSEGQGDVDERARYLALRLLLASFGQFELFVPSVLPTAASRAPEASQGGSSGLCPSAKPFTNSSYAAHV